MINIIKKIDPNKKKTQPQYVYINISSSKNFFPDPISILATESDIQFTVV